MSFTITYGAERYATLLPNANSTHAVGALLPAAALKGIRELADPRGDGGLAHQVFGRKRAGELVARSRGGDLQATAVQTSGASDHVVTVHQTAKAAASVSAGFAEEDTLRGGSLAFSVDGQAYSVAIASGSALADVADAIKGTGADVEASVFVEDGQQRLSVVRRTTGYQSGLGADSALSFTESYGGGEGRTLDLSRTQTAQNARVTVDQQTIERRSNTINNAVAGTTLRLDEHTGRSQVLDGRDAATLSRSANVSAFTVSVQQIAAAAESRSTEFASPYEQVQAGKVLIKVDGGQYWIPVNEGASLVQTAASINASAAPVQAKLERHDSGVSLAIIAKNTGFEPGTDANTALQVSFEGTGQTGQPLAFKVLRQAQNAKLSLNGQAIESRSNELAGAAGIPRLSLKETTNAPQTQGSTNVNPTPASERPSASTHIARMLQEQVVALATQPLEAGAAAAQAKKLYAPVEEKTSPKVAAKAKGQDKAGDAPASRLAAPADRDSSNSVLAASADDDISDTAIEPVSPAKPGDVQTPKGALGSLLEQLKNSGATAKGEKTSPYAPPPQDKEDKSPSALLKQALVPKHAVIRKAKHAYAQHAA